jgi:hypothetical protein
VTVKNYGGKAANQVGGNLHDSICQFALQCNLPISSRPANILERGCPSRSTPDGCGCAKNLDASDAVETAAAGTAAFRFGFGFAALCICLLLSDSFGLGCY